MVAKIIFSVLYAVIAFVCFYVQTLEFSLMFLLVGVLCVGLIGWNFKKMLKKSDDEDVEAKEQW